MDPESYKVTMNVISDAIKILGPAIITAIVGYKVGKYQLLIKMKELNKNNEFKQDFRQYTQATGVTFWNKRQ
jgi:hypothetical protein